MSGDVGDALIPARILREAALVDTRNLEIVDLLDSRGSTAAPAIAAQLGREPDALRIHLEDLERSGVIERDPDPTPASGPQSHRYRLVEPSSTAERRGHEKLVGVIARLVEKGLFSPADAEAFAKRHGADIISPDADEEEIRHVLGVLGFPTRRGDPEADAPEMRLVRCPFAATRTGEAGEDVVCRIHRGLVEGMAAHIDSRLVVDSLGPDGEAPGCRLTLSRRPRGLSGLGLGRRSRKR